MKKQKSNEYQADKYLSLKTKVSKQHKINNMYQATEVTPPHDRKHNRLIIHVHRHSRQ